MEDRSSLLLGAIIILAAIVVWISSTPAMAATSGNGVSDVNLTIVYEAGQLSPSPWSDSDASGASFSISIIKPDGSTDTFKWSGSSTTHAYTSLTDPSDPSSVAKRMIVYVTIGSDTWIREYDSGDIKAMVTDSSEGDYSWLFPFPPPSSIPVQEIAFYIYDPAHVITNATDAELVLKGGGTSPYFPAVESGKVGIEVTSVGNAFSAMAALAQGRGYHAYLRLKYPQQEEIDLGLVKPAASSVGLVVPVAGSSIPSRSALAILYNSTSDEYVLQVNLTKAGGVELKNESGTVYQAQFSSAGNYSVTVANATVIGEAWGMLEDAYGSIIQVAIARPQGYQGGSVLGIPVSLAGLVFIFGALGVFLAFTKVSWPIGAIIGAIIMGVGISLGTLPPSWSVFVAGAGVVGALYIILHGGGEEE